MGVEKGDSKIEEVMEAEKGGSELVKAMTEEQIEKMKEISLKKQHFVLVHGVSHGAWCWYKIKTLMENSGYKVTCLDLKGSGIDQTDPNTILTFDEYNKPLLEFLASLPDDEQVILVGHSAGGLNVTDATHKFPNKISLVFYVAATMLRSGFVTEQDVKDVSFSLDFFYPRVDNDAFEEQDGKNFSSFFVSPMAPQTADNHAPKLKNMIQSLSCLEVHYLCLIRSSYIATH